MPVQPTWFERELPVLEAAIALLDGLGHPGFVEVRSIANRTGTDPQQVFEALLAMQDEYVTLHFVGEGDPNLEMVTRVTPAGRRAVGQWPSAESLSDRLLVAMQDALDHESDPVRRAKLRSVTAALTGMGREVLVSVVSAAITGDH
jgi:hypothetical protein